MNPHPRIRKTIKWGGAAVTVLLVVVWIGSGWWGIVLWDGATASCVIARGALCMGFTDGGLARDSHQGQWESGWLAGSFRIEWMLAEQNASFTGPTSLVFPSRKIPGSEQSLPPTRFPNFYSTRVEALPLWPLVVLAGAGYLGTLAYNCRARRRTALNFCPKCGYDRTGILQDAKCPECGSGGTPA